MNIPTTITDCSALRVAIDLSFRQQRSNRSVGHVIATFSVTNHTVFTAYHPFIAFSVLGLDLETTEGWKSEHVKMRSGRRMLRMSSNTDNIVNPGQRITPVRLKLLVSMESGGSVQIIPGRVTPLRDASDMNVHFMVGAANFPCDRSIITIQGNDLRAVVPGLIAGSTVKTIIHADAHVAAASLENS